MEWLNNSSAMESIKNMLLQFYEALSMFSKYDDFLKEFLNMNLLAGN